MDICIVTNDDVLARFLILELSEAGFSAVQSTHKNDETKLNIYDLDFFTEEISKESIGFSYSDASQKRVQCFLPRPISAAALTNAVKEKLAPRADTHVSVITVEKSSRKAKTDKGEVRLSEKELALLMLLCDEKVLSHEKAGTVFGDGESNIVNVYMHYLRKKLKSVCPYDVIESKRSAGYSLIYPIEVKQ